MRLTTKGQFDGSIDWFHGKWGKVQTLEAPVIHLWLENHLGNNIFYFTNNQNDGQRRPLHVC